MSAPRPKAVVFDILETVFPLDPLRPEIVELGLPPSGLEAWFTAGQRDLFALTAAGDFKPFAAVLADALMQVLGEQGLEASPEQRQQIVAAMKTLKPRPDAREAFALLQNAGLRPFALTNGSAANTQALFEAAQIPVEHIVSIDEIQVAKPRREIYHHAAKVVGVAPRELALVAAHPWDLNGAKAAGLATAYLALRPYPATMRAPDFQAESLLGLSRQIVDS